MTTQPEIKLPPLPEADSSASQSDYFGNLIAHTSQAMQDYARQCVLADRAERAETVGVTFKELTLKARIVELTAERDAWMAFAEHQQWCATCGESVNQCDEGSALRDAAAPTQERGADDCQCAACKPLGLGSAMRMILCPTCGNKRCPHATNHIHPCTGSNEPGQPGSRY